MLTTSLAVWTLVRGVTHLVCQVALVRVKVLELTRYSALIDFAITLPEGTFSPHHVLLCSVPTQRT